MYFNLELNISIKHEVYCMQFSVSVLMEHNLKIEAQGEKLFLRVIKLLVMNIIKNIVFSRFLEVMQEL